MHHSNPDMARALIFTGISLIIVAVGYFLPTIIAFFRGHAQRWNILVLNVLLGWTGFVWIYLILKALDFA